MLARATGIRSGALERATHDWSARLEAARNSVRSIRFREQALTADPSCRVGARMGRGGSEDGIRGPAAILPRSYGLVSGANRLSGEVTFHAGIADVK